MCTVILFTLSKYKDKTDSYLRTATSCSKDLNSPFTESHKMELMCSTFQGLRSGISIIAQFSHKQRSTPSTIPLFSTICFKKQTEENKQGGN